MPLLKLAFKAATGRGARLNEEAEYVWFPRFTLNHAAVLAQNARLMDVAGDSMKDMINDGDLMLIDVSPSETQMSKERFTSSRSATRPMLNACAGQTTGW